MLLPLMALSPKQRQTLLTIAKFVKQHGCGPTLVEAGEDSGERVLSLVRKGYLYRLEGNNKTTRNLRVCGHCLPMRVDTARPVPATVPRGNHVAGKCRHCRAAPVTRPRGLCWTCYSLPGVREMYPSVSKFGRRGAWQGNRRNAPLPATSTDALPGSEEKIAILAARAAAGQALWHPHDTTIADLPDWAARELIHAMDSNARRPSKIDAGGVKEPKPLRVPRVYKCHAA